MSKRQHAIYLSFDDTFLPHARACLNSLRENYPDHPKLIVDYTGDDAAMAKLLATCGAERLSAEPLPEYVRYLKAARAGVAAFQRLKLWRHSYDRFETILHLDADTLILKPLDDLFDTTVPYFVANFETSLGVHLFQSAMQGAPRLHALLDEDGLQFPDQPCDMANAGVFALPRKWRSPQQIAMLAYLSRRYGHAFAFADQSLLSLWLMKNDVPATLNFGDNFQTPMFTDPTIEISRDDIRILHFSSGRKPGTAAFERWDRVGEQKEWLLSLWRRYGS